MQKKLQEQLTIGAEEEILKITITKVKIFQEKMFCRVSLKGVSRGLSSFFYIRHNITKGGMHYAEKNRQ